ncbi:MAG: multicopper oxidase domain-containing protein [Actinomycetia bacterium]|nr:multicopper oxidase domain-containing protein [Actinomycetes bacterium]
MSNQDRSVVSWFAFAAAMAALVVAIVGVSDNGGETAASSAGGDGGGKPTITITMADNFTFTPNTITIPTDGAIIRLVNEGTSVHNMTIPNFGLTSPVVAGQSQIDWEIGPFAAGEYEFQCPQAGHASAGMTGTLIVTDSGSGTSTDASAPHGGVLTSDQMTASQMDALMLAVAQQYPAVTEGHGGDVMEPTILPDGTKEFVIVAKVVKWEVEPGLIVDAWTYNGVVPAPEIHVLTGDKVRLVLQNELPDSTSLHLHGIQVPNVMDGVDPYTEAPTTPGGEHVYEFVAKGPAVGIYHSHHNAQEQIPNGMFGAFTIDEMPIPQKLIDKGYTEVTKKVNMVLNDAGVIGLSLNGKSFPATEPYTLRVGQVMQVNYLNEGLLVHPMHLHQPSGWIIAKDGVPLDEPTPTDTVLIAPGERYTVLYMGQEPGVWAWHCHILNHAETPTGMRYMVTALIVER